MFHYVFELKSTPRYTVNDYQVMDADIFYITSDGRKERVQFDKITARVSRLCYGLDMEHVDAACITQKVISGVYQGVTTVELDNLVSNYSSCSEIGYMCNST